MCNWIIRSNHSQKLREWEFEPYTLFVTPPNQKGLIRTNFDMARELIPVRNPAGILGKMKKYFILLNKDLFKQKCDYILYF